MLNELGQLTGHLLVVLDDCHAVESRPVHDALMFLLDNLPAQVHLVLATRADPPLPLARWRVRRQLLELRADDLRFTAAEATALLHDVMDVALSGADISTLQGRTEGWVAGLQMAALSLQGRSRDEVSRFVAAFLEWIASPTLIVSAEDDLYKTMPGAAYSASQIRGARLLRVEHGGHLLIGGVTPVWDKIRAALVQFAREE